MTHLQANARYGCQRSAIERHDNTKIQDPAPLQTEEMPQCQ
jgi:hypothetical protein